MDRWLKVIGGVEFGKSLQVVRGVVSFPLFYFSGTVEICCINVKIYFVIQFILCNHNSEQ